MARDLLQRMRVAIVSRETNLVFYRMGNTVFQAAVGLYNSAAFFVSRETMVNRKSVLNGLL